jgi:SAM-dependent methyltransferase
MEDKEIYSPCFADYYDVLYSEKNYKVECDHLQNIFIRSAGPNSSVLDIGCGTGIHAINLGRRGYKVHGIDLSQKLISKAIFKKGDMANVSFEVADARTYHSINKYGIVISMFGVLSYQLETDDLIKVLKTVNRHLVPGGIFIFDFWNGPAVLNSQRPNGTMRKINTLSNKFRGMHEYPMKDIYKFTEVIPDGPQNNLATIHFTIFDMEENVVIDDRHRQRFFFMHEIEDHLKTAGLKIIGTEGGNLGTSLLHADGVNRLPWNVTVIARKEKDNEW